MIKIDMETMTVSLKGIYGDKLQISTDKFFSKLMIDKTALLDLMRLLKDDYGFNQLSNLTAVDFGEEFEVVYHLYTLPGNNRICVKTRTPRTLPEVDTLIDIWPAADWQEREVYDLMGINFKGHPNLIRVLLPDDFEGHPLRKDFVRKG